MVLERVAVKYQVYDRTGGKQQCRLQVNLELTLFQLFRVDSVQLFSEL